MMASQFDGASLFSGGGFMPSQATQTTDSGFSSSKNRGDQCLLPLTVKQITEAFQPSDDKPGFVVDGVDVSNVFLVGMVLNKAERITDVSFTLDDGTGRIDVYRWLNEALDSNEIAGITNGMYVQVIGNLKGFQGKRQAVAFCIRPVTDCNDISLHFIDCVAVHLYNTKLRGGIPTQPQMTNSVMNTPFQNVPKGNQAAFSNQFSGHLGMDGSGNDFYQMVLAIFLEPMNLAREQGLHVEELVRRLNMPIKKVMEAVQFLEDAGNIYSTIDENHYKSAREN
eukprot:TRINITY_DN7933_c0_g1_i2.p1 TRINITY_DN7933_c0_g1~~TRINITY_DN7933_c0_g1_i2.p1  ORF type:complete len:281 (+),score=49.79 TRINITY_DN7933_c0_g1_i2:167-1009(+)